MTSEEMIKEAKIKIETYKILLEGIEEHGVMFAKAVIEGRLQAEEKFVKIMEGRKYDTKTSEIY